MSRIFILMLLLMLPALIIAQTNTFPTSGNAGIGTTSPAGPLDVYEDFIQEDINLMGNVMPNPSFSILGDTKLNMLFDREDNMVKDGPIIRTTLKPMPLCGGWGIIFKVFE